MPSCRKLTMKRLANKVRTVAVLLFGLAKDVVAIVGIISMQSQQSDTMPPHRRRHQQWNGMCLPRIASESRLEPKSLLTTRTRRVLRFRANLPESLSGKLASRFNHSTRF